MKIVIYTSVLPYPLDEGGKVAQYTFISELVKYHEVTLVTKWSVAVDNSAKRLTIVCPKLKIILVDEKAENNEKRFLNKLLDFIRWQVVKMRKQNLDSLNIIETDFFVNPIRPKKRAFVEELFEIIQTEKPDLIQIDFIDNAELIYVLPSTIKKILVVIDLRHSSVHQYCTNNGVSQVFKNYLVEYVKVQEMAVLRNFDGIITYSDSDKQRIAPFYESEKIIDIPFAADESKFYTDIPNTDISKLVFLGPSHHTPNLDAVIWYAEAIGQEIFQKHGLKLCVVGNWTQDNIVRFKEYNFIEFCGFVDDLIAFMEGAILIVPLRIGSGIRTKIIEAFAMGVPVISSEIGAEGIGAINGEHILIANEPGDYIRAVSILLNDDSVRQNLRSSANALCNLKFSPKMVYDKRISFYKSIVEN